MLKSQLQSAVSISCISTWLFFHKRAATISEISSVSSFTPHSPDFLQNHPSLLGRATFCLPPSFYSPPYFTNIKRSIGLTSDHILKTTYKFTFLI